MVTLSTNIDDFTEVFRAFVEDCYAGCPNADHVCLIKTGIEGDQNIQNHYMFHYLEMDYSLLAH